MPSATNRLARRAALWAFLCGAAPACGDKVEVGSDQPALGGTCVVTQCGSKVAACGDCVDNDADGLVDLDDPECLGPCQNAEDSFFGSVPLQSRGRCAQDCYFDDDAGFGNDGCVWNHHCDPLSVAPDFYPEGEQCAYDPSQPVQGSGPSCETAALTQSSQCLEACLPLTPPGCDCFGCCIFAGAPTPVWLGSNDGTNPTCTLDTLGDPSLCRPCTQVMSCLNATP
jgi:hypothetical protein